MLAKLWSYLRLAKTYIKLNLHAQLEYRGAFISQILAMFFNDCVWLTFWILFFTRFPILHGWTVNDVITMWAVVASGIGLSGAICGNAVMLPILIARGQIDTWMVYPRMLLPHLLLGRMGVSAWGDALFGLVAYVLLVKPDLAHLVLFLILVLAVAVLFVGFSVLSGSLGFFVGNAEVLAEQWRFSLITFSTYPATLFDGAVKLLLYTLVPAAFCSYLPIEALRQFSLQYALLTMAGAMAILLAGICVFYFGLRRYESGNLTEMRG